jgi:aminopeptidase N
MSLKIKMIVLFTFTKIALPRVNNLSIKITGKGPVITRNYLILPNKRTFFTCNYYHNNHQNQTNHSSDNDSQLIINPHFSPIKSNRSMRFNLLLVLGVLFFVSSCSSSKKATRGAVVENLDTVMVTASRDNPYRASATKDFDLQHTKLEVKFDYAKQYLYGKATLALKPHFYPQTELVLDAKHFDINKVSVVTGENNSEALPYTYDSLQLKIKLDKTYTRDETLKVLIDYTAKPNDIKNTGSAAITDDRGLYFINPLGKDSTKPIQIWTQGETESNSCWFPTIDKPNQKATEEIYITRPNKYVSLSNGTLVGSTPAGDSMTIDHWKCGLPFAPYLVMMAIGDFAVVHDRWRDVPVDYYVERAYAPYAKQIFGNTPQMMEFFSQKLDFDFPWPKYSQVVVRDYVSGAMENVSATLHGDFIQRNARELLDETYEDVISHELFHQWFGDLVTCESWSNIPLNESFATYGQYLWNEYKYGREMADCEQAKDYRKYMNEAAEKNVDLIRFYYNDREDMFDATSYEKGGLVLNYLRHVVGDDAFFKSLQLYLKNNQFKPVEIHNLRLAFEEVTGKDMNWFFNEWFLNNGHPVLNITYSNTADSIYVTVEQKHNTDKPLIYQLPAKIAVWYGTSVSTYDVWLKKKSQTFAFKAQSNPDFIDFDPERAVLCERKDNKTADNYLFEYKYAPYYYERIEALKNLAEIQEKNTAAKQALIKALSDTFYYLRQYAIGKLVLPKDGADSLITRFENTAKADKVSSVRTAAVKALAKLSNTGKYADLFETVVGDSSYEVSAEALKALEDADSRRAMEMAKKFEGEKNYNLVGAVADVYSKEGDAHYQDYFEKKLHTSTGYAKYTLFYYYANFLIRMDKPIVLSGIETIEKLGNDPESHFMAGAAKGALKRISKSFEDKKAKAKSDMAAEPDKTAKLNLQEQIGDYDTIISASNDAFARLNKKGDDKE